jgi:hypothetical protein
VNGEPYPTGGRVSATPTRPSGKPSTATGDRRCPQCRFIGTIRGTRPSHVRSTVKPRVRASVAEITGAGRIVGGLKSEAGLRTVALPRGAVDAPDDHLATYGTAERDRQIADYLDGQVPGPDQSAKASRVSVTSLRRT